MRYDLGYRLQDSNDSNSNSNTSNEIISSYDMI